MASLTRSVRPAAARITLVTSARRFLATTASRFSASGNESTGELALGELQGAKFKIEPLRRVGEDDATKRARLICSPPCSPLSSTCKPGHRQLT